MATWLITGCSTGLGRALASTALGHGETVVATARDATKVEDFAHLYPDNALALSLDVRDHAQRRDVVRAAQARFGIIDVLVNNAGHGIRAAVEETEEDQAQELFATNFFGPVGLIQWVLPGMRERRRGTIVNISSIGARQHPRWIGLLRREQGSAGGFDVHSAQGGPPAWDHRHVGRARRLPHKCHTVFRTVTQPDH